MFLLQLHQFFATMAIQRAWLRAVSVQLWHHTLTEFVTAHLKAQFLNSSCVESPLIKWYFRNTYTYTICILILKKRQLIIISAIISIIKGTCNASNMWINAVFLQVFCGSKLNILWFWSNSLTNLTLRNKKKNPKTEQNCKGQAQFHRSGHARLNAISWPFWHLFCDVAMFQDVSYYINRNNNILLPKIRFKLMLQTWCYKPNEWLDELIAWVIKQKIKKSVLLQIW